MDTSKMKMLFSFILILFWVKSTKADCTTVCLSDLRDEVMQVKSALQGVKSAVQGHLLEMSEMIKGIAGPWILVQRHDFTVDAAFGNKKWADYKKGFGESGENSPEFWIGLDKMHELTESGAETWTLRVQIKYDKNRDGKPDPRAGTLAIGEWTDFKVGSEAAKYRLNIGKKTRGENFLKDVFHTHELNGQGFTTTDSDNDKHGSKNCATYTAGTGAWWLNTCSHINLNARRTSYGQTFYDGAWRHPSVSAMWMKRN